MEYQSTRDTGSRVSFQAALVQGLAKDGGLFVPTTWPVLDLETATTLQNGNFRDALAWSWRVFGAPDYDDTFFSTRLDQALGHFPKDDPLPLQSIGKDHWLLDLTQGPTLSFKDVAMQCLGNILPDIIPEPGRVVLGATSGDTGPAALFGFKNQPRFPVVFLYPDGAVSPFQRQQMTTMGDSHLFPIAIDGDFDTCQSLVKSVFALNDITPRLPLLAVNSINWGRIIAQIAYYIFASLRLTRKTYRSHNKIDLSIPTGNFGNAYAAFLARRMGAPIDQITIACNRNNTLARCVQTGILSYQKVVPTISPSMDVQIPSNFERCLFEYLDRDDFHTFLNSLSKGSIPLPDYAYDRLKKDFLAETVSEDETSDLMNHIWQQYQTIIDPHTAVACAAGMRNARKDVPLVTVMTAAPAKFHNAVFKSTGVIAPVPDEWQDLASRKESRIVIAPESKALLDFIEQLFKSFL